MAQDIFANTSGSDIRKRWALMQLAAASDSSPVKHPLQAVARAMQGGMGGYMAYQADQADKDAGEKMFSSLPGLGGGMPSAPQAAAPAQAGPSNFGDAIARIESGGKYDALGPVTKTGDRAHGKYQVMGANIPQWTKAHLGTEMTPQAFLASPEAQDAVFKGQFGQYAQKYGPQGAARAWFAGEGGMNNPNARDQLGTTVADYERKFTGALGPQMAGPGVPQMPGAAPAQMAQAPGGTPQGGPARTQMQIPPEVAETIKRLGADPRTRPQAWQMYLQYAKPTESVQPMSAEQRKQWNVPEGVSAGIDTVSGKPIFSQPANSVSVNTAANPLIEGVSKQIVEQRKGAHVASSQVIPAIHDARKALDAGVFSGAFAQGKVDLQKIGGLFGLSTEQAANTEVLRSSIGSGVLAHIKELGANPSNADRDYIEKVQGGQIALEENSIRRILDIQEKYARQAIKNFNRDAEKLMRVQGGDQAYKSIAPLMAFEEPPAYVAPERAAPPPAAPAARSAAPAGMPKAPPVGHIQDGHMFKGGNPADPNSWVKQ
jgi:hypothetical protein